METVTETKAAPAPAAATPATATPVAPAPEMISSGQIVDAKSIIGLTLTRARLLP